MHVLLATPETTVNQPSTSKGWNLDVDVTQLGVDKNFEVRSMNKQFYIGKVVLNFLIPIDVDDEKEKNILSRYCDYVLAKAMKISLTDEMATAYKTGSSLLRIGKVSEAKTKIYYLLSVYALYDTRRFTLVDSF